MSCQSRGTPDPRTYPPHPYPRRAPAAPPSASRATPAVRCGPARSPARRPSPTTAAPPGSLRDAPAMSWWWAAAAAARAAPRTPALGHWFRFVVSFRFTSAFQSLPPNCSSTTNHKMQSLCAPILHRDLPVLCCARCLTGLPPLVTVSGRRGEESLAVAFSLRHHPHPQLALRLPHAFPMIHTHASLSTTS
jgi:hypothetical protein